ncbi:MAG: hypothetical protein MI923_05160 [Phycisphaerales bacterium]|nr:hypothetical protein [Phycisphaerales bacterium]
MFGLNDLGKKGRFRSYREVFAAPAQNPSCQMPKPMKAPVGKGPIPILKCGLRRTAISPFFDGGNSWGLCSLG